MTGPASYPFHNRVRQLCPDLRVEALLRRSDKTVVLAGVLDGIEVIVKLLIGSDSFWQDRFTAEINTYTAFESAPPPLPAPRLIAADLGAGILVATHLPGDPASPDRYPDNLDSTSVRVMLQAGAAPTQWAAPDNVFAPVWDYPHRFARYRTEYGLLDAHDEAALNALAAAAGPLQPAHGDLLPSNVLRSPAGDLTGVLDWEFTGRFLPGLDAALVWLVLGRLPTVRHQVELLTGNSVPQQAGFWANVTTLCVRELRTHTELPDGPLRTTRLPHLTMAWQTAQARVHELARMV